MSKDFNPESQNDWKPVVITPTQSETITRGEKVNHLLEVVDSSMGDIYLGTFDHNRAEKIAAAAWSAQYELSKILPDARLRAKQAKNFLKLAKAQADKKYRELSGEKRKTESQLEQLITSDPNVITAEDDLLTAEHEADKWECILASIRDSHIFFKNLNKT